MSRCSALSYYLRIEWDFASYSSLHCGVLNKTSPFPLPVRPLMGYLPATLTNVFRNFHLATVPTGSANSGILRPSPLPLSSHSFVSPPRRRQSLLCSVCLTAVLTLAVRFGESTIQRLFCRVQLLAGNCKQFSHHTVRGPAKVISQLMPA